jgi:hypothetical protein
VPIIRFSREVLSDAGGGFFASQDADVTPEDEGGYFTWTERDFRDTLNDEEYQVLRLHFLQDRGSMHHDATKKVLFIAMEPGEIAASLGMHQEVVVERILSGKAKLLKARDERISPFIDTTLYTSLNGLLITSFLRAFKVLGDENLKKVALRSLERILEEHSVNHELFHTRHVKAILDDYIFLTEALISAYETTGNISYINTAVTNMDSCIEKFWDKNDGGFFDTDAEVLGIRLKGVEDIPHPSANSVGISLLLKLHSITGEQKYLRAAETALKLFSVRTKEMGIHAGSYFCALDEYFQMLKLTIRLTPDHPLAETARMLFYPYVSYAYEADQGFIVPCFRNVCYEPVRSPEGLRDFFRNQLKIESG